MKQFYLCTVIQIFRIHTTVSSTAAPYTQSTQSYKSLKKNQINHGYVTSKNNLQRSIKIIFFCVYKNKPKPTTAFKMT